VIGFKATRPISSKYASGLVTSTTLEGWVIFGLARYGAAVGCKEEKTGDQCSHRES
jgi:hypothetical protein